MIASARFVFKAHRLSYHSTPGSRATKKEKKLESGGKLPSLTLPNLPVLCQQWHVQVCGTHLDPIHDFNLVLHVPIA